MPRQRSGLINGVNPLIYKGSNPNMVIMPRKPTPKDGLNWPLGYWWLIPTPNTNFNAASPTNELWVLVGKKNNICKWIKLLGSAQPSGNIINKTYVRTPGAGTYTPTPGMIQCTIELIGGGGSSTAQISDGQHAVSIPGGGGAYCRKDFTAADIGTSVNYVIGAGGVGNNSGGAQEGVDGTNSTFGAWLTAGAGKGGTNTIPPILGNNQAGAGGVATGGDLNIDGLNGLFIYNYFPHSQSYTFYVMGFSGGSFYGPYGSTQFSTTSAAGLDGYNGSGGGAILVQSATDVAMASNGGDGLLIITEVMG